MMHQTIPDHKVIFNRLPKYTNDYPAFMAAGVILVGVWIFLVWMVWKKKTNIFHDNPFEPKLAERRYKMLKTFLLVAGISLAVCIGLTLQIAIFRPPEEEGSVFFYVAFFSVLLFVIGTIGGLVIFLKGRRKTT